MPSGNFSANAIISRESDSYLYLDQANGDDYGAVYTSPRQQAFTAGKTGLLKQISLLGRPSTFPTNVTIAIYEGNGTGGELLGQSTTYVPNFNSIEWTTWTFASVPCLAGQVYTIYCGDGGYTWAGWAPTWYRYKTYVAPIGFLGNAIVQKTNSGALTANATIKAPGGFAGLLSLTAVWLGLPPPSPTSTSLTADGIISKTFTIAAGWVETAASTAYTSLTLTAGEPGALFIPLDHTSERGALGVRLALGYASGDYRAAIYTDNAGAPGDRVVAVSGTIAGPVTGEVAIEIPLTVLSGARHWLAIQFEAGFYIYTAASAPAGSTEPVIRRAASPGAAWASPLPATITTTATAYYAYAGFFYAGLTADAVIAREKGGSITAGAAISLAEASHTGSLTADALLCGGLTAGAVIEAIQAGNLSADAWIAYHFSADATITAAVSGNFTADAAITRNAFTAAAVIASRWAETGNIGLYTDTLVIEDEPVYILIPFDFHWPAATAVRLRLGVDNAAYASFEAAIYSDNTGVPGTLLSTLTPEGSPGYASSFRFSGVELTSLARYWIAVRCLSEDFTFHIAGAQPVGTTEPPVYTLFDPAMSGGDDFPATMAGAGNGIVYVYLGLWLVDGVAGTVNGLIPADAIIAVTQARDIIAGAVITIPQAGTLTANALIALTPSGTLTADCLITATQAGQLEADSVISTLQAGDFGAAAVIVCGQTGTLPAGAIITAGQSGHFEINSVIVAAQVGYFGAAALIVRGQTGTLTAGAIIAAGQAGQLEADSVISTLQAGDFGASAVVQGGFAGAFTAGAVIAVWGSAGNVGADAVISGVQGGTLTASALLIATLGGDFGAGAVITTTPAGAFTAGAVITAGDSGNLNSAAIISRVQGGTLTASALITTIRQGSLLVDGLITRAPGGTFTADCIIAAIAAGNFTADSVITIGHAGELPAGAVIRGVTTATIAASAIITATGAGRIVAEALITDMLTGTLTAGAVIRRAGLGGDFEAGALIALAGAGQVEAGAIIAAQPSGTLAAGAVIRAAQTGAVTANAFIRGTAPGGWITTGAVISAGSTGAIAASAFIRMSTPGGWVTASAVIATAQAGAVTAGAVIAPDEPSVLVIATASDSLVWTTTVEDSQLDKESS